MGKKKDGVYLGVCLSPAARRDLKQLAARRRQLLPSRKPPKTSTPCAAHRAHKKDLSQVNYQLYEWLTTMNERFDRGGRTPSASADTLAGTSETNGRSSTLKQSTSPTPDMQAPSLTSATGRRIKTASISSISQKRGNVNPGSQKSQEGRGVFCCLRSCARALTRGYRGHFQGQTPLFGSLFYAQNTCGKSSFRKFGKVTKKRLTNHRKFL